MGYKALEEERESTDLLSPAAVRDMHAVLLEKHGEQEQALREAHALQDKLLAELAEAHGEVAKIRKELTTLGQALIALERHMQAHLRD
ncbi:MAG: hypothetical protein D6722_25060 [Bacteroidetes bacterium]|nr:MAG: hypothetical protein D6722_25060 [Bacteroidota bacterium]